MPSAALPPSPDAVLDALRGLAEDDALDASASLRAGALFARLKSLNRTANTAARAHKQVTADARTEMDQTHLGLQNLLYEKRHLEREIEKCRQFASIYQDIPLRTPEEFSELAPEDLRSEEALADEHQLMLNRLSYELVERQSLEARRKELTKVKDDLLKQTRTKQTTADNVKAQLDLLMKTATEIQKKVDELVPAPAAPPPEAEDVPMEP